MKRFFVVSCLLLLVLSVSQSVRADSLTLTDAGSSTFNGVSAGPYAGMLNGNSITMVCVSYDRRVTVGQTWDVTVNTLTSSGVAGALYGMQTDALLKYQQAAWLYDQMSLNSSEAADIHGAIWNIFIPGTPDSTNSNHWLELAQSQDFTGYDFSRFRILTPVNLSARGPQEFLTTVPEPATMLLMGTGLAGVASKLRKRRKNLQK